MVYTADTKDDILETPIVLSSSSNEAFVINTSIELRMTDRPQIYVACFNACPQAATDWIEFQVISDDFFDDYF